MQKKISNNLISVWIDEVGCELKKVVYNNIDYLHDANPLYWGKTAPILFPNIGTIKDGYSIIDDVKYKMIKHGFLKEALFETVEESSSSITLKFTDNESTKMIYPYSFTILISYEVVDTTLLSKIKIINDSNKVMPFNLGLHPAFKVPLLDNESFEDYHISFDKQGTYEIPYVDLSNGTIDYTKRVRTLTNLKSLPLNYDDYKNDALIFENVLSHKVTLANKNETAGVEFTFDSFTHLGIWTPFTINSPFICIEPWIGSGDIPTTDHIFTNKRDIITLESKKSKEFTYSIRFF